MPLDLKRLGAKSRQCIQHGRRCPLGGGTWAGSDWGYMHREHLARRVARGQSSLAAAAVDDSLVQAAKQYETAQCRPATELDRRGRGLGVFSDGDAVWAARLRDIRQAQADRAAARGDGGTR